MFRKVLVANRGEIAVRIMRTLREMGIASVAAYSDADRDALFVEHADEAYRLGSAPAPESYLNGDAIIAIALQAGAEAIHPGYGFLAENAAFAHAVERAGLVFVGPSPRAIQILGDKVEARRAVRALDVPVVPGTEGPVATLDEALSFAREAGYPVAVKAAGGGGGRGIRVVAGPQGMAEALERARREAEAYFKNPEVYLERYFPNPKHVEIQVLGDRSGHLVHLGERDCSIQRRHQKVIEETPSPAVDRDLRARMGEMALRAARSVNYSSAGTAEFLLTEDGTFYFLEMNARIQVEHPITERVTGVDIVREMLLAAAGEPITVRDDALDLDGHAFEVRVNAEDPSQAFRPTPTTITRYHQPGGTGIRMDSGVYQGYTIPEYYDSLIAKVIAWGRDREAARLRMLRALREYRIEGPATTIAFAEAVLRHPVVIEGCAGTAFVETNLAALERSMRARLPALTAPEEPLVRGPERSFDVEVNRKLFHVRVTERQPQREARARKQAASRGRAATAGAALLSPMHGTVITVKKNRGDSVEQGETVFIIEAMKMENEVPAQRSGTITSIEVKVGDTVETDQRMAVID